LGTAKGFVIFLRRDAGKKRIPAEVAAHLAEHMGENVLTPREVEVLRHLADRNRNKDIGDQLFISEETVKVHIKQIMEKLIFFLVGACGDDCRLDLLSRSSTKNS
jgi:DNA-binding CsgD family transcriptional regulator